MPWLGFPTKAAWQAAHDQVCADQGIPRPGKRQSDGAVQLNNQWTTAAFAPLIVNVVINAVPRKIGIVRVPAAAITKYNLAASVISDPTDNGDGTWTVTFQGSQYTVALATDETAFPFQKPKPPTWTDTDGTVYQVP